MDASVLDRYADLIVAVGANVQPGQVLATTKAGETVPVMRGGVWQI